VPFLVEDMLRENGGVYSKSENWQPHVAIDGNLVTGQNPASSDPAAKMLLQSLDIAAALAHAGRARDRATRGDTTDTAADSLTDRALAP